MIYYLKYPSQRKRLHNCLICQDVMWYNPHHNQNFCRTIHYTCMKHDRIHKGYNHSYNRYRLKRYNKHSSGMKKLPVVKYY